MAKKPVNAVKGQQGFQKTGRTERGKDAPAPGFAVPSNATDNASAGANYGEQFTRLQGENGQEAQLVLDELEGCQPSVLTVRQPDQTTRKRYLVRPSDAQGIKDFDYVEDAQAYRNEVMSQGRQASLVTRADVAQVVNTGHADVRSTEEAFSTGVYVALQDDAALSKASQAIFDRTVEKARVAYVFGYDDEFHMYVDRAAALTAGETYGTYRRLRAARDAGQDVSSNVEEFMSLNEKDERIARKRLAAGDTDFVRHLPTYWDLRDEIKSEVKDEYGHIRRGTSHLNPHQQFE